VEKLCENICKALQQPWLSPQERQEAEAQQAAEEERRRQEVEDRRVAEEERRRREAEAQQAAKEERRRRQTGVFPNGDFRAIIVGLAVFVLGPIGLY
jgi:hypothetical protein